MRSAVKRQVVFVVAHDAYLKGARNILKLMDKDIEAHWFTTSHQLADSELQWLNIDDLSTTPLLMRADIVFAGLGGKNLNRLINNIRSQNSVTRPEIIGYFPGILHLRIFESLMTRLLCDKVLLNCERDYLLYRNLVKVTTGFNNGILFGAPWISQPSSDDQRQDIDLLFVEQSIVPESLAERRKLVRMLNQLAIDHPGKQITVALRALKGGTSSHQLNYCLEEIWLSQYEALSNLQFIVADIDQLLVRSKQVATVSSSVAYTSLAWGKSTTFINDFGTPKRYGNDLFRYSGYLAPLVSIFSKKMVISPWCRRFVLAPSVNKINEIISSDSFDLSERGIPGIAFWNIRLILRVLLFCLQNMRNPISELNGIMRTVKNINTRIYDI